MLSIEAFVGPVPHTGKVFFEVQPGELLRSQDLQTSPRGRTWRLLLSYDGSDFHGWQVQPGQKTVQGELRRVILGVLGEDVLPQGSGRTDTGVHADGQVVSVVLQAAILPDRLVRALNRRLPGSVRVLTACIAAPDFHARANVVWKRYTYRVFQRRVSHELNERICQPMMSRTVWDCRWPLCLRAMQEAAAAVLGVHDFTSFAARDPDRGERLAAGEAEPSRVRRIFASTWAEEDGLLVYRVDGNGFLHHMVRNLVGTFVDVGAGRRAASMADVLAARNRSAAGLTAPPQGLSLTRVVYRDDPDAGVYA